MSLRGIIKDFWREQRLFEQRAIAAVVIIATLSLLLLLGSTANPLEPVPATAPALFASALTSGEGAPLASRSRLATAARAYAAEASSSSRVA